MELKISLKKIVFLLGALAIIAFIPVDGFTDVPQQINYQGYLTDDAGNPLNGSYMMTFAIYDVANGGAAQWSESRSVAVTDGIYNVQIGQDPMGNPFPEELFGGPRWLGVTVGTDTEMTPRQPLTSVPYALNAQQMGVQFEGHLRRLEKDVCNVYDATGTTPVPPYCCPMFTAAGFLIQSELNTTYLLTAIPPEGPALWSSATHDVAFGTILPDYWEILLKPGGSGAERPAICAPDGSNPGNPFDCTDWREWTGSGFAPSLAVLTCVCKKIRVSGFETQAVVHGDYRITDEVVSGQPVWASETHTIAFGTVAFDHWEILLKPELSGAQRPAICQATAGNPGTPFSCADWREWRGSSLGFVSVSEDIRCID